MSEEKATTNKGRPSNAARDARSKLFTGKNLIEEASVGSVNWKENVEWVYLNLNVKRVDPKTAPSSGALAMLTWARQNTDQFWRYVEKAMVSTKDDDRNLELERKDRFLVAEIEKMLEETVRR